MLLLRMHVQEFLCDSLWGVSAVLAVSWDECASGVVLPWWSSLWQRRCGGTQLHLLPFQAQMVGGTWLHQPMAAQLTGWYVHRGHGDHKFGGSNHHVWGFYWGKHAASPCESGGTHLSVENLWGIIDLLLEQWAGKKPEETAVTLVIPAMRKMQVTIINLCGSRVLCLKWCWCQGITLQM